MPPGSERVGAEGSWVVNTIAEGAAEFFGVVDSFAMGGQVSIKGEGSNEVAPGQIGIEHFSWRRCVDSLGPFFMPSCDYQIHLSHHYRVNYHCDSLFWG